MLGNILNAAQQPGFGSKITGIKDALYRNPMFRNPRTEAGNPFFKENTLKINDGRNVKIELDKPYPYYSEGTTKLEGTATRGGLLGYLKGRFFGINESFTQRFVPETEIEAHSQLGQLTSSLNQELRKKELNGPWKKVTDFFRLLSQKNKIESSPSKGTLSVNA